MAQVDQERPVPRKRWWRIWTNYHDDVRYLDIDYGAREREGQILKIVDDNGFKVIVFFVAASGFLASSYSLFATNVITPALYFVYPPCDRLSGPASEVIDELTFTGTVLGMLIMGHLADRSGRKRWYGVELSVLLIATMGVVQASEGFMADNQDGSYTHSMDIYSWISWWRFLLGYGIGSEYPLSAIITAEWASTESRGTMLAAVFSMQSVGRLLAFAIGLGALRITSKDWGLQPDAAPSAMSKDVVDQVWRWTIGIGMIPAAIAILMRLTIPETPRYYADIMEDLKKAVKNALRIYSRDKTGRRQRVRELGPDHPTPARQNSDEDNEQWYAGAWNYLTGPRKAWRNLASISVLWGVMDAAWYSLSMDSPSAISTLAHDPSNDSTSFDFKRSVFISGRAVSGPCADSNGWNSDFWNRGNTIYDMLQENSLRSILVVSIAAFVGSMVSIVIINRFRRRSILVVTFLLISVLFAVAGATLIVTYERHENHVVTTVFYAILQFVFNVGPNTLIFVVAAEIFPTVYRGTFYGIAAAAGKVGAIIIRAIIGATGNKERSLGIRLLVFIPFMLLAAGISWLLPDVQYVPKAIGKEAALEQNAIPLGEHPATQPRPQDAPADEQAARRSEDASSIGSYEPEASRHRPDAGRARPGLFGRLKNMTLEDIAPNPAWDRRDRAEVTQATGAMGA